MKYNVASDLLFISQFLNLSHEKMADKIGIPFETFSRIVNNNVEPSHELLEKIYNFIFEQGINLNKIKCANYSRNYNPLFFHGSKNQIVGEISLDYSRKDVDFGVGFYTGDNYEQSLDFVAQTKEGSIYILVADLNNLRVLNLEVELLWMLIIAYHRGKLKEFENTKKYKEIENLIATYDVIIGPIADNRMFTTIDDFVNSAVSSEQAIHALNALALGKQIVFKNKKAISKIKIIDRLFACKKEKETAKKMKMKKIIESDLYVKEAYRKYLRQGLYITEIFDDERND